MILTRPVPMPRRLALFLLPLILLFATAASAIAAPPGNRPTPGYIRVQIQTSMGTIVVSVDTRRAPVTAANFLAYADDGRFDGTYFYRAARSSTDGKRGLIQGGIDTDKRRARLPIAHEPTSKTGISHGDATLSMARGSNPNSAMGDFFLTVGPVSTLDARQGYAGYAAFGHVVAGMDVVKRILTQPTGGGRGPMRGQMLLAPIRIVSVKRLDGVPKPTTGVKPWLVKTGR